MYLKSLELHGFKSFPNKTVLSFEPGATVVIGPNGSGKSNISDAMRWVLGEISTKNIRGTKMEDVIFGGADTRKPMSFAEVSVTFDNSKGENRIDVPYDEITVTRRFYRAGDSEYFINRKAVRLKDIHELFMNTGIGREGYSVIGQGKIAEILSRKSEDRRNIFEEAAGIAKYRYKRHEAEKKLGAAEENLVRLTDIAAELGSRVAPLEKESRKAKKYLEIYESKKRADVSLWIYDGNILNGKIEDAKKAVSLSRHELEVAEDSLASLETQSDRLFEESQKGKATAELLLSKINELTEKIHTLDSDYKLSENESAHKKEMTKTSDAAISDAEKSIGKVKSEMEELDAGYELSAEAEKKAAAERDALDQLRISCIARARSLSDEIDEKRIEIQKLRDAAVDVKVRISVLESSVSTDAGNVMAASAEVTEYEKEAKQISIEIADTETGLSAYAENAARTEALIKQLDEKYENARSLTERLQQEISDCKVKLDGFVHRAEVLERMEELLEGYSAGVRFVMQSYKAGEVRGGVVYGPVSRLINVPEKYVTAIETAFGANIQNIVVENEDAAKSAIEVLKAKKAGRATFYPLTSVTAQDETEEMIRARDYKGYIGRADLLFDFDEKFSEVMRSVLGRTLVFDNLDNASVMARAQKYHVKVVTLDGQVINAGGSYTGGSARRDSGILTRAADIKQLRKSAEETEAALEKLTSESDKAKRKEYNSKNAVLGANQQREIVNTLISTEKAHLEALNVKLESNANLRKKLYADIERLKNQSSDYNSEIEKLTAEAEELDRKTEELRLYRDNKDSERNEALDEQHLTEAKIAETDIKTAEARKDAEAFKMRRLQLQKRIDELEFLVLAEKRKIFAYAGEIKAAANAMAQNREEAARLMTELATVTDERGSVESGTAVYEQKLNDARLRIREKNLQKETVIAALNKNESRLNSLISEADRTAERMLEEYELTYTSALALGYPTLTAGERGAVAATAAEYRREMKAIGNVNIGAIEEYDEVKTRYDEMSSQINDLTKSRAELSSVIGRLESEMREKFADAFNRINKNFTKVFAELFGGGTAELVLTEPEDVLSSGIEIKAAPPGKIIKNLSLLSGGEQAFVAIALFFAILKVNPSPFCILDEIEAALDEVNVSRFAEYVKRMSDDTQFILITHRRGTMEAADRIYGVTMPERGISKVLSLNIGDMEFKV